MENTDRFRRPGEHPIDAAARLLGGRDVLAARLGLTSVGAIGNWKVRGVPIEHCARIERELGGVVSRRELRPDDWMDIWPELAAADAQGAAHA